MRRTQKNEKLTVDHVTASGMSRDRNNRRRLCPNDMSILANTNISSPRRSSVMPPPSQLDMTRRHEIEGINNEMPLLYDKYLQTIMTEHIMRKKEIERQKIISIHSVSIEKKSSDCERKLHEIQMRINELESLNEVQKYLEHQIEKIRIFLAECQSRVTEILDKIHTNLQSFDKLSCENIIVPKSSEEFISMHNLLDECGQLLELITLMIGNKSTKVISTNDCLKKFGHLTLISEKLIKEMYSNLERVQIDLLKKGSATLIPNNM